MHLGVMAPFSGRRELTPGLPATTATDTVALLTSRFAASHLAVPTAEESLSSTELVQLFRSLAFIVRTTFGKVVNELEDFAYLTAKFWPRWRAVREQGNRESLATTATAPRRVQQADSFCEWLQLRSPRRT